MPLEVITIAEKHNDLVTFDLFLSRTLLPIQRDNVRADGHGHGSLSRSPRGRGRGPGPRQAGPRPALAVIPRSGRAAWRHRPPRHLRRALDPRAPAALATRHAQDSLIRWRPGTFQACVLHNVHSYCYKYNEITQRVSLYSLNAGFVDTSVRRGLVAAMGF